MSTLKTDVIKPQTGGQVSIGESGDTAALEVSGNLDVTGTASLSDILQLTPMAEPAVPAEGMVYYDSGTSKLRCYDGSTWQNLF